MKETKPIPQQEELHLQLEKAIPSNFKVARDAILQLSKTERDLFTDIEEAESGNYIISGLQKYVTELDLTAFTFAAGQILYNQSYQSGNEKINSGIDREEAKYLSKKVGETIYNGKISTSLSELCRLAYGTEPTTELKKKMATLIDTIDRKKIKIKFPNGDLLESKLCITIDKYTRDKDGAIFYNLYLNPIFGSRIQNQFGELPQDIIEKLDKACKSRKQRKHAAHYLLIRWLSVQDKRYSHTLTINTLIKELRMEEYFRKDRGKAEKQLLSIFDTMVDVGILSKYDVEYSSGKRNHLTKVTFHLNKSFIRLANKEKGKEDEKA